MPRRLIPTRASAFTLIELLVAIKLQALPRQIAGEQATVETKLDRSIGIINGLPLIGFVSFRCQDLEGGERYVMMHSVFDSTTQGWIPVRLMSMPSHREMVEIGPEASKSRTHEILFHVLIPDGYISTSEGLVRE